jgi:large subunit ribosomal protein L21
MFAVIKTGGKQYKVSQGNVFKIERLEGEIGDEIAFEEVLMISDGEASSVVGAPFISGAAVKCRIINQTRDPKIIIFKKKRRQNYRRKKGHKQHVTFVKVLEIKN